ncbi:hypothetical protein [Petrachloros mirabilis]
MGESVFTPEGLRHLDLITKTLGDEIGEIAGRIADNRDLRITSGVVDEAVIRWRPKQSGETTCIDYEEEIDNLCLYAGIDQSYGYDLKLEKLSEFIKAANEREQSSEATCRGCERLKRKILDAVHDLRLLEEHLHGPDLGDVNNVRITLEMLADGHVWANEESSETTAFNVLAKWNAWTMTGRHRTCNCPGCQMLVKYLLDLDEQSTSTTQRGHPTCSLYCEGCRKMVTADRIDGDLVCQECGRNPTPESTHGEEDSR